MRNLPFSVWWRKKQRDGWLKHDKIIESLYCHTPCLASRVSFIRYMILDTITNALYLIVSRSPAANSASQATAFTANSRAGRARREIHIHLEKRKLNIHIVRYYPEISFDGIENEGETNVHGVLGRDVARYRLIILFKFFRSFVILVFFFSFFSTKSDTLFLTLVLSFPKHILSLSFISFPFSLPFFLFPPHLFFLFLFLSFTHLFTHFNSRIYFHSLSFIHSFYTLSLLLSFLHFSLPFARSFILILWRNKFGRLSLINQKYTISVAVVYIATSVFRKWMIFFFSFSINIINCSRSYDRLVTRSLKGIGRKRLL